MNGIILRDMMFCKSSNPLEFHTVTAGTEVQVINPSRLCRDFQRGLQTYRKNQMKKDPSIQVAAFHWEGKDRYAVLNRDLKVQVDSRRKTFSQRLKEHTQGQK